MRRAILFFFTLLILSALNGCSDWQDEADNYIVDPFLRPYFEQFKEEVRARGIKLKNKPPYLRIVLGDLHGQASGMTSYKHLSITLDTTHFNGNNYMVRDVCFHEFGHMFLMRVHDMRIDSIGRPLSVMYPAPLGWENDRWPELLNELFK